MKNLDITRLVVSLENHINNDIEFNLENIDKNCPFVFNFEDGSLAVDVKKVESRKRTIYFVIFDGEWYEDFSTSVERQLLENMEFIAKNKIMRKPLEVQYLKNINDGLSIVNVDVNMIFNDCLFNAMEKIEMSEYLLYSNSVFNRCEFCHEG